MSGGGHYRKRPHGRVEDGGGHAIVRYSENDMETNDSPQSEQQDPMGHRRPRRCNPETISYLRSLPFNDADVIQTSRTETETFLQTASMQDDESVEFPATLHAAMTVLDEMMTNQEFASVLGDEYGSMLLQSLINLVGPYSSWILRVLLYQGVRPYLLHLISHRYASHVVQSLLTTCDVPAPALDVATHPASPWTANTAAVPALADILLELHGLLLPQAREWATHLCASHVLRTVIGLLGGVQVTDQHLRPQESVVSSSSKKKKKKRKLNEDTGSRGRGQPVVTSVPANARLYQDSDKVKHETKQLLRSALESLVDQIVHNSSDHNEDDTAARVPFGGSGLSAPGSSFSLQQLACHPSAGPLLSVLLRVLTYSESESTAVAPLPAPPAVDRHLGRYHCEPRFTEKSKAYTFVQRMLSLDPDDSSAGSEALYELATNRIGSRLVETILHTCSVRVYRELLNQGGFTDSKSIKPYLEHDVANFVVQCALATVPSSAAESETSDPEHDSVSRERRQRTSLAEVLFNAVVPYVMNGYVIDPQNHRRSVLWRLVEMAASQAKDRQTVCVEAIRTGFSKVYPNPGSHLQTISLDDIVPLLLQLDSSSVKFNASQAPPMEEVQKQFRLDVEGTRTLYNLLQFDAVDSVRHVKSLLRGIWKHCEPIVFEQLVRDGLGSRCVVDGIFDFVSSSLRAGRKGSFDSNDAAVVGKKALRSLLRHLQGRWVSVATDRVGHHTARKLFLLLCRCEDYDSCETLVQELSNGATRLNGSTMGRTIAEVCALREFKTSGVSEWRRVIHKRKQKDEMLRDTLLLMDQDEGPRRL
jgi:hypothetical protein